MKWSTALPIGSAGIRVGCVQFSPSGELVKRRSLAAPDFSNRLSDQVTKTVPAASISAEGSGIPARMPPAGWWKKIGVIVRSNTHVAPPSLELKSFSRNLAAEK